MLRSGGNDVLSCILYENVRLHLGIHFDDQSVSLL